MYSQLMLQLKLYEDFITDKIDVDEFLKKLNSLKNKDIEIDIEKIPSPIREHEISHALVLEKYGVKYSFFKDKETGIYYVGFDAKQLRGWKKEKIVKFLCEIHNSKDGNSSYDNLVYYLIHTFYPSLC